MSRESFSERFCAKEGIPPEKFGKVVLRQSLYPMARLLSFVLWLKPGHFGPDKALIVQMGTITQFSDFEGVAQDYIYDPSNRGLLRQRLNLRLSITRLRRIVRSTMQ